MRKWRGTIDVPLTYEGYARAGTLGHFLPLDVIYHDPLSRCRDTAEALSPARLIESDGPRPWKMGPTFEGQEITPESIARAQWLVRHAGVAPEGGESFSDWYWHWMRWVDTLKIGYAAVGVITHNRNIQALYSRHNGVFHPKLYNVDGPDFLSVHVYHRGHIAPWNWRNAPAGLYLIRHGETSWGT